MSMPDDEEWTLLYGYRVGSRPGIDLFDPHYEPFQLRCPCCNELAWFSRTLVWEAWERCGGREELAPILQCLDCAEMQLGWDDLGPEIREAHEEAVARYRQQRTDPAAGRGEGP
ncbi:MAG: hypothetical protein JO368_08290 [Acidimicrobiales bacterium]|nr:hypothetical protein [Acidimicrobiales bacterium]